MRIKLNNFLKQVKRNTEVLKDGVYPQIGVRVWGKGSYVRDTITGKDTQYKTLFQVRAGDLIINKIWTRNGAIAIVPDDQDGCFVSTEFPTFEIDTTQVDPNWLSLRLATEDFWHQCALASGGTSGKNRIKVEKFLDIEIELPEKDRQILISKQMAKVISISNSIKEKIAYNHELLEKYDKKLLLQLISQDSKPVVTKKLSELCSVITDGAHNTPTYLDEGVPFLSVKDITSGSFDFINCRHISKEEHLALSKRCKPELDDVLYTKVGTTGIAKRIDINKEFSIFVSLCLLKPNKDKVDSNFLEIALNSSYAKRQAKQRTRGIGNKNLVLKDIREIQIPWIEKNKQTQIVTQYKTIKSKTDDLIKFLHKLEESIPQLMEATFISGK